MFCLASEMADKMASPLLTDSQEEAEMGQALLFAPMPGEEISDTLLKLGIRLPSPEQLGDVPMERMAIFAEQRGPERQRIRLAIEGIVEAAKGFADPNAMGDYLSSQRKTIKTTIDDLLKTIDELRVGSVSNVAKITVPAGVVGGLAAFNFSPEVVAILSGLGLIVSGISCYAETRGKLRQARTAAQYHYLLSVSDDLGIQTHESSTEALTDSGR